MGLEWVLVAWGIAQLLILGGVGAYAHAKALSERDAQHVLQQSQRENEVTITELEVARAQLEVLRKAATDVEVDLDAVRNRVRADRARMLRAAGENPGQPGGPASPDPSSTEPDRRSVGTDLGAGDRIG